MGLGDDIMSTVAARKARKEHPQANIVYGNDGEPMKRNRIHHWSEIFENNPNTTPINLIDNQKPTIWIHDYPGNRPYIDMSKMSKVPSEFRRQTVQFNLNFHAEKGDLYFSKHELNFADNAVVNLNGFVLIEPNSKTGMTKNRDWGFKKWQTLVDSLYKDYTFVQCGPPKGNKWLNNVKKVTTDSFRKASVILSKSICVVTSEGGMHHAAAALNIPGTVIFGERTSPKTTGYNLHSNLYIGDLDKACGMNLPCDGCKKAMDAITVDWVEEELLKVLR